MDALTFDEGTHTYRVGGLVKPSVTQLLNKLHDFGMVPADVLQAACERGTYVHLICQYHDECDLGPVLPQYEGYLAAWRQFLADKQPRWDGIELQGYSSRYGYAGTMDRAGRIAAKPWILDIKTSLQPHRVWGLQLAAYRQLIAEKTGDASWLLARRGSVQLRADGTYKFLEWHDSDDWPCFLSLINLINWTAKA